MGGWKQNIVKCYPPDLRLNEWKIANSLTRREHKVYFTIIKLTNSMYYLELNLPVDRQSSVMFSVG